LVSEFQRSQRIRTSEEINRKKKKKKARGTRHCVTHLVAITLFRLSLLSLSFDFLWGFKILYLIFNSLISVFFYSILYLNNKLIKMQKICKLFRKKLLI
jgi:hypothetical protein